MITSETKEHKTPNGGTRSVIYYQDANGNPVDKKDAKKAEIIELDDVGNEVGRTYGML